MTFILGLSSALFQNVFERPQFNYALYWDKNTYTLLKDNLLENLINLEHSLV